jgi:hypothetical protein
MLRVTQSIELALRKKESRYSQDFWKALGLAAAIHISLFLVFRIAALPNFDALAPIAPIDVEIDLGSKVDASLPIIELIYSPIVEGIDSPQYLDDYTPLFQITEDRFYLKKTATAEPDFSAIETIDYELLADILEEERE